VIVSTSDSDPGDAVAGAVTVHRVDVDAPAASGPMLTLPKAVAVQPAGTVRVAMARVCHPQVVPPYSM
jgi:hypothetical protein